MTRNARNLYYTCNTNNLKRESLPEGWRDITLRDVLSQRIRKVRVVTDRQYTRLGVHWYGQGCFKKDAVYGSEISGTNLFEVAAGDFIYNRLFAWKGSFAVVATDMTGCYVSNEFPVFEVDASILDPHYLWRWFSLPLTWRAAENLSRGSTRTSRLRFREEDLLELSLPVPPLHEQRAIVQMLDRAQRAKETTDVVITATRELKKSLMRHLFTYGPVPVQETAQVPLKETEIGPIPQHWTVMSLGETADISTGTTPSTNRSDYYSGDIPFIKTSEIANNVITSAASYVSEEAVRDYRLKLYPPGTVFLAMYGQGKTRGQVSLLGINATITQNTAAIAPKEGLDSVYLWMYLTSRYGALREDGIQGHISHLNLGYVRQMPITIPPLREQEIMAKIMTRLAQKLQAEENRKKALDALFNSLLHNLMTGKVRVG